MTRQASTQGLRQRIESRNNVTLLPIEDKNAVTYHSEGGTKITLSPQIIKTYLVNGQGNVSDQEVMMFLQLCKFQGLNPFLREAYLIKYGSAPATIVVGKEVFTKRAERHPDYKGHEAGIYVLSKSGEVKERKGTMTLPNETVIGGWAKVYRDGYSVPIESSVSFEEYVGRKGDGSVNAQWSGKPATMIRKVALVQALREAFPAEFGGMYSQEEIIDVDGAALSEEPLDTPYMEFEQDEPAQEQADQSQLPKTGEVITEARWKRMFALAKGNGDIVKQVCAKHGYESSKDVQSSDYNAICAEIEGIVSNPL